MVGHQIVFRQSKLPFDCQMVDSLPDVVKRVGELYMVAGGFKLGYTTDSLPTQLKVQSGSEISKYTCGYQAYTSLPRIFLTFFSITPHVEDIQVDIKWVYHEPVHIYCCAFAPTADLSDETRLRDFLKTCKYKQKYTGIDHINIIKFKMTLDVVYYSMQEYDASYIAEENAHDDEIDGYNIVLYMYPTESGTPHLLHINHVYKSQ